MGRYCMEITLRGTRSAHNSLQDRLDEAKWRYIRERIDSILARDDFTSLGISVEGPDEC